MSGTDGGYYYARNQCGTMNFCKDVLHVDREQLWQRGPPCRSAAGPSRFTACRRWKPPDSPRSPRLPYSMKILLENLLRHEDGRFVKTADIEALARWDLKSAAQQEISFAPARVLLQDFTGVPGGRRSRGDARRHRAARRRSEPREPAAAGRARHRSLGAGRLLRPGRTPFS